MVFSPNFSERGCLREENKWQNISQLGQGIVVDNKYNAHTGTPIIRTSRQRPPRPPPGPRPPGPRQRPTCDMTGFGLPLKGTASVTALGPRPPDAFSSMLVKVSSIGIRRNCIMHCTCGDGSETRGEMRRCDVPTRLHLHRRRVYSLALDCPHTWVWVPTLLFLALECHALTHLGLGPHTFHPPTHTCVLVPTASATSAQLSPNISSPVNSCECSSSLHTSLSPAWPPRCVSSLKSLLLRPAGKLPSS